MRLYLLILLTTTSLFVSHAYAQSSFLQNESVIPITQATNMDGVRFDGKWSFTEEWKPTSWTKLDYDDGSVIHFRSGHFGDFLYFLIDFQNDESLDYMMDNATICIDSKNNKNQIADKDDYCFSVSLNQKSGFVFQGGSIIGQNSHIKKIENPDGFIATSSPSDKNDRYSQIPHSSYEFRIPTSLVDRSNNYGLFLSVYEATSNKFYNWPQNVSRNSFFDLPSPKLWGNLVSPDKSIPEFQSSLLLLASLIPFIILSNKMNYFR